ncbi:MAG: dTDP-4-dehydrorhamnose reductase [Eubacteriales bacterium]|nr:dTDP-4-dehydrorhamnose reductase [Eubacteriales bacterium]
MRVLVTGYNGQLGFDLVRRLELLGIDCKGVDIQDFDLTQEADVMNYIRDYAPDTVVHCAAFTAVDRAEEARELCFAVNVTGTENVAKACQAIGARLMYFSTDYVFKGEGDQAFEIDEPYDAQGYYGLTKALGEVKVREYVDRHFIVRISWVFGANGNNFVKTMLRLGQEKTELTVVADQIGSPTYTYDLCFLLTDMLQSEKYGTYHASNEGICSWADFATAIMQEAGLSCQVRPVTSDQYPTKAVRPKNSRLSKRSLDEAGFKRLPTWQDALKRYLQELG